jgi:hypothetical protein
LKPNHSIFQKAAQKAHLPTFFLPSPPPNLSPMNFLKQLNQRNPVLYYFGWIYFLGGIFAAILSLTTDTIVLGINAWIKPMKFFFSIWIFVWTMAWFLRHLENKRAVRRYTVMVVIVMIIEQVIITWQAANGRLSHFNIDTPLYQALFYIMGAAITVLTAWTGVIGFYFFKQKTFSSTMAYIWGIRLGIVLFVIFSFEGGIMASRLAHTVGAPDGGPGLPIVNWSTQYGDLRIAHFVGIHALQVLPLFGYYVTRKVRTVQIFAAVYFAVTAFMLIMAFRKLPVIS